VVLSLWDNGFIRGRRWHWVLCLRVAVLVFSPGSLSNSRADYVIGGVVHPIYLHFLIPKIGFSNAIRVNALVVAVAGLISCLLMRTRLPTKKWDSEAKFLDFALFKQRIFAIYCVGTFFVV
jgi:hypothetical protein